jgi:Protein of unknown function (DUF3632)
VKPVLKIRTSDPDTVLQDARLNATDSIMASAQDQIRSRERFSLGFREDIDNEAAKNDPSTLMRLIGDYITNVNCRYTAFQNPIILFEWDLHDLWHLVVQSAKITDADDAGQDRLVNQVLYAKEIGMISRMTAGGSQEARTSDGVIWTDLPYLVADLQTCGIQSMSFSATQRRNFAAFTARLTGLGIADLSSYALWLFRETLEVARPIIMSQGMETVSVEELLPACITWFRYSGHKLLRLSANNHSPEVRSEVSSTCSRAYLEVLPGKSDNEHAGFSIAKWVSWRQRFEELTRCQNESVATDAKSCFQLMMGKGREMGLGVPGEEDPYKELRG